MRSLPTGRRVRQPLIIIIRRKCSRLSPLHPPAPRRPPPPPPPPPLAPLPARLPPAPARQALARPPGPPRPLGPRPLSAVGRQGRGTVSQSSVRVAANARQSPTQLTPPSSSSTPGPHPGHSLPPGTEDRTPSPHPLALPPASPPRGQCSQ